MYLEGQGLLDHHYFGPLDAGAPQQRNPLVSRYLIYLIWVRLVGRILLSSLRIAVRQFNFLTILLLLISKLLGTSPYEAAKFGQIFEHFATQYYLGTEFDKLDCSASRLAISLYFDRFIIMVAVQNAACASIVVHYSSVPFDDFEAFVRQVEISRLCWHEIMFW